MNFSLEKETESLKPKTGDPYTNITNMTSFVNDEEMALIARTKFYPCEFIDAHTKLTYKGIPPKEVLYSKVKLDGINANITNTH